MPITTRIPIRKFQRNLYEEVKNIPAIVTRRTPNGSGKYKVVDAFVILPYREEDIPLYEGILGDLSPEERLYIANKDLKAGQFVTSEDATPVEPMIYGDGVGSGEVEPLKPEEVVTEVRPEPEKSIEEQKIDQMKEWAQESIANEPEKTEEQSIWGNPIPKEEPKEEPKKGGLLSWFKRK